MKLNNKGYSNIELLGVLAVFSVMYILSVSNVTHALEINPAQDAYDEQMNIIQIQALAYANFVDDLFKEEETVTYIYVEDLIEANFMSAEDGVIINPLETNKNLNKVKIKIEIIEEEIVASVVEL